MNDKKIRMNAKELYILAGILTLAFFLRGAYIWDSIKNPNFHNPILDASFHDYWARGMATNIWPTEKDHADPLISNTPYQKPPGYPYFLSIIYRIFGPSYLTVRIIQIIIGTMNCLLAFLLAKKWFGSAVAIILAFLMSTYWTFIYFEGELYAPVLLVFISLILIYTLSLWTEKISFSRCGVTGLILGLFALIRANVLLFVPVAIIWLFWILQRRKNLRFFSRAAVGFILGVMLAISPASIRNHIIANDLVLISSNGGLNLYIGNNEYADAINPIIPALKEMTGLEHWTPFDYPLIIRGLEKKLNKSLKHSQASAYWINKAKNYIQNNPTKWLMLTAKKFLLFWGPSEIGNPTEIHYARLNSRILKNIPGNFSIILSFSIIGIILLFFEFRSQRSRKYIFSVSDKTKYEVTVLILLFIAVYFLSFLPFLVSSRFRVPIIPFLLLFGSYALNRIARFVSNRAFLKSMGSLLVVAILYLLSNTNFAHYQPNYAQWRLYQGVLYSNAGQFDRAINEYNEALRYNPNFAEAYLNLGTALASLGEMNKAIKHFYKALRIKPNFAEVHNNLGEVLKKTGKPDEAAAHFAEAVRIMPDFAEAHNNLAEMLEKTDKLDEAVVHFSEAIRIKPDYEIYYINIAFTIAKQGNLKEAIYYYSKAMQIKSANTIDNSTKTIIKKNISMLYQTLLERLSKQKDYEKMLIEIDNWLKIDPKNITAYGMKGVIYHKQGDPKMAKKFFNKVLELDQENKLAKKALIQIQTGRY